MNAAAMKRLLEPLHRRIKMMVTRGVLHLVDSEMLMQTVQVELLSGEVLDRVEHFEPYGFTANPHPGAEVLAVGLAGRRAHTIVVSVGDRRYRLTGLAQGEVALYTDEGDYIQLKRDGNIEIVAGTKFKVTAPEAEVIASTKVRLDTPSCEMTGDQDVTGNSNIGGDSNVDGDATFGGTVDVEDDVNTSGVYHVDGVQVVGNQGAAVADAISSVTSCMNTINAALARMRAHGLIAT
jgi:phage baseplate assembly protein V